MYDTVTQAREVAVQFQLRAFIAEVAIANDESFRVAQTGRVGHWTVWGEPDEIIRYVVAILSV